MKTFLQILASGLIVAFSISAVNVAKANDDRTKEQVKKVATKTEETKQNAKVSNVTTSANATNPVIDPAKANDWNSTRSNKTSKTSMKILKDGKQKKEDDSNK